MNSRREGAVEGGAEGTPLRAEQHETAGAGDTQRLPAPAVSAWAPLRHKVYRALWFALLATNIGAWMQAVGAAWLMVELDASPTIIALVQTATFLPVVLVGVVAGALADLVDRRRLLLATQLAGLAVAAALAAVTAAGAVTPLVLLGFTFALGVCTAFNGPAYQAIQPELVPARELKQALTLGGANINLGRAIGPAVGGALIAAVGAWLVFGLNAAAYLGSVVVLWRWRRAPDEDTGPPEHFAGAIRAGVRYALFSRMLQGVLLRSSVFGLASSALLSLLPVYASKVLGAGSGGLGLLYAGIGVGAVTMAALLPRLRARLSDDRVFIVGSVTVAAALAVYAAAPYLLAALAASFVAGLGWLCCLSTLSVASQDALPSWVRARGLAFCLTALSAGVALGAVLWGMLASADGVRVAYAWGAAALVVTLALAFRWRFDAIARLDLSPSPLASPETRLVGEEHADSPAFVLVSYEVRPECEEDFLRALRLVGRVRRRNGATDWSFYRDAERADRFIETFVLATWDEHVRQHQRLTVTDAAVLDRVNEFLKPGTSLTAEHYIQPPEPPLELWPR